MLTEPRSLRRIQRWLLPPGRRTEAAMAAEWQRVSRTLRIMMRDLFATPDLDGDIARLRARARVARWRAATQRVRRRIFGRSHRRNAAPP